MPAAPKSTETASSAGRYVPQPDGSRIFFPAPLPPNPPVRIDGDLQILLSRADRALGRLDGAVQTLPDSDHFILMYARQEAVLSSQIEGTQSTLHDLLAAEAEFHPPGQAKDVGEVRNYINAMNHGLSRLAELPVSTRLIREIHQILMHNVRGANTQPGEFRRSQNWIGASGCTIAEARFVPPPPQEVSNLMSDLEKYVHQTDSLPALIRIGLIHAQFETIHPFLDGNGRTGRLLITFLLCEQKILLKPVLYLSLFFNRHRSQYYEKLQAVSDIGDWHGWLEFFMRAVVDTSAAATTTIREILTMREQHRAVITDRLAHSAGNGLTVLEHLYARPILSVLQVQKLIGTSYPTANHLVVELTDAGILEEITGRKRNRLFRYSSYIRIFEEPPTV